jgi:hypothetical protein
MNLKAYANHRKELGLRGTSHVAVLKAIDRGRLMPPAVERVGRGWRINPELADAQWADATHPAERGTGHHTRKEPAVKTAQRSQDSALPTGIPPRSHSEAIAAAVKAKRETILLQKEEGTLVYREDFEAAQAAVMGNLMLGAASLSQQIKTDIPRLTQEECDKIQARIDDLFKAISDMNFEELDQ